MHPAGGLTRRELETARLVAEGLHNKQIAHRMSVTEDTVKKYVQVIAGKLDITGRGRSRIAAWYGRNYGLGEVVTPTNAGTPSDT